MVQIHLRIRENFDLFMVARGKVKSSPKLFQFNPWEMGMNHFVVLTICYIVAISWMSEPHIVPIHVEDGNISQDK